jgi:hypothetical protein
LKKSTLYAELQAELSTRLAGLGFTKALNNPSFGIIRFERPYVGGVDAIHVYANATRGVIGAFDANITLHAYHEAIEKCYDQASEVEAQYQPYRGTIVWHSILYQGSEMGGSFRSIAQAQPWLDRVAAFVRTEGDSFWRRFDSVEKIDRYLNDGTCEEVPEIADLRTRAELGIVAAHIAKNANFSKLNDMYLRTLKQWDIEELYVKVVKKL